MKEHGWEIVRLSLTATAAAALLFIRPEGTLALCLWLALYFFIGVDLFPVAVSRLVRERRLDETFLMVVATVGALVLGEYAESVAVLLFYRIGELLEDVATDRSRDSVRGLLAICPDEANTERDGKTVKVPVSEIAVGDTVVVFPGERIPVDGTVTDGDGAIDTSPVTGESVPRDAYPGVRVASGCVSRNGVLRIRAEKSAVDSSAARMVALVNDASEQKSKAERFLSAFARIYTPAVCAAALLLAVAVPLLRIASGADGDFSQWIYRALSFLVVSCPCALVVSVPLTFFCGVGRASREGILVKGADRMETLAAIKTVAFDKTGTLTAGRFAVTSVEPVSTDAETLLCFAAHAEICSTHPIAAGIREAYGKGPDERKVSSVNEQGGRVSATVDGDVITVGSAAALKREGIDVPDAETSGTVACVAKNGIYIGRITLGDRIKETARAAIDELSALGIWKTVVMTGDNYKEANRVAQALGISNVRADMTPRDKVEAVAQAIAEGNGRVAFVGDGINDAPVLTRADVGFAMGTLGTDAAIDAADVVLPDDDPRRVAKAIRIGRLAVRTARFNTVFAIAAKIACLVAGALGCGMWVAVTADVGVMLICVAVSSRILKIKNV